MAETGLPARVLMRPAATIYATPDPDAEVVRGSPPPFRPWFIYETRALGANSSGDPTGWYRVGENRDAALGWAQAVDVMPWNSALVVTYANPGADPDVHLQKSVRDHGDGDCVHER